jgi:hypothetical protein
VPTHSLAVLTLFVKREVSNACGIVSLDRFVTVFQKRIESNACSIVSFDRFVKGKTT